MKQQLRNVLLTAFILFAVQLAWCNVSFAQSNMPLDEVIKLADEAYAQKDWGMSYRYHDMLLMHYSKEARVIAHMDEIKARRDESNVKLVAWLNSFPLKENDALSNKRVWAEGSVISAEAVDGWSKLPPEAVKIYTEARTTQSQLLSGRDKAEFTEDMKELIRKFDEIIKLVPNFASAYYDRSVCFYNIREYDKALQDAKKAIELFPSFFEAYTIAGSVCFSNAQFEKAIEYATKSIEINPVFYPGYNTRALAYLYLKNKDKALENIGESLRLDDRNAETLRIKAMLDEPDWLITYSSEIKESADGWSKLPPQAVKIYTEAKMAKAQIYADIDSAEYVKEVKELIKKLDEVIGLAPNFASAYYCRSFYFYTIRECDKSLQDAKKAIELCPDFFEACLLASMACRLQEEYGKAFEYANKCIEIKPAYLYGYNARALSYLYLKNKNKALKDIEESLRIDNNHAEANRIKVLLKEPDWAEIYTSETKHYIVKTNISQTVCDNSVKSIEGAYMAYTQVFPPDNKSVGKTVVYVFKTKQEFVSHGTSVGIDKEWLEKIGGLYNHETKEIYIADPKQRELFNPVLYHEGFHQYIDNEVKDSVSIPTWFNEGCAQWFYGSSANNNTIIGYKKIRVEIDILNERFGEIELKPLKTFFMLDQMEFYKDRPANYAQAWSFVYFCFRYKNGRYESLLRDYYKEIKKGSSLQEAFDNVFGRKDVNFDVMEKEWKAYVEGL
ncbi:MAG: DUF1570 domain-containing protein [Planctomycetes bacterium]|nr:DUF1570 domain-containing protein [Planctomycetota bacterium]